MQRPGALLPAVLCWTANITLSFSYPVELSKLAVALKVAGRGAGSRTITVSPCTTFTPLEFWPPVLSASRAVPASSPAGSATLRQHLCCEDCARPGCRVVPLMLRLPKGSRYSSVAGPVQITNTECEGGAQLQPSKPDCWTWFLLCCWQLGKVLLSTGGMCSFHTVKQTKEPSTCTFCVFVAIHSILALSCWEELQSLEVQCPRVPCAELTHSL